METESNWVYHFTFWISIFIAWLIGRNFKPTPIKPWWWDDYMRD